MFPLSRWRHSWRRPDLTRLLCQCHGALGPSCGLVRLMDAGLHTPEEKSNMETKSLHVLFFFKDNSELIQWNESRSKTVCCIKSEALTQPGLKPLEVCFRCISQTHLCYSKGKRGAEYSASKHDYISTITCSKMTTPLLYSGVPRSFQQFSREICNLI